MENDQLCRLCATAAGLLLPIFEAEGVRQKLAMKIKKYLPIQVAQDDCLPHHVCYSCSSVLNSWHNLVEECIISDKKLRNLVVTQQKHASIMANEEVSFQDTVACEESEDENGDKEVVREETEDHATVTHSTTRCEQASSVLSKFRIKKSLDPKTTLFKPVPENMSISSFVTQNRDHVNIECSISNYNDDEKHNNCEKEVVTVSTYSADLDFPGQVLTVAGSNRCDDILPKSCDNFQLSTYSEPKDTDQPLDKSASDSRCLRCDVCQTVSSSQLELAAHRMASHSYHLRCKHCEHICNDNDQLEAHEQFHKRDVLYCQVCSKTVSTFRTLKLHFSVHADTGLGLCNFCNSVFSDETELKNHEATHQNEKPYLCETCGKAFRYKANMLNHCSTHLDDSIIRKFKCDICGTVYRSKNILKRHLALHNNEGKKNCVCVTCGKSFLTVQSLKVHVKVHSNSRPYKCTVCEMAFKWKKNLRTHQRVHGTVVEKHHEEEHKRRIARVQCEICGKYLASKWNLSVHVKRHDVNFTGSSMCHICGKTLCDSQAMSRHLKVHAGIKPFKCAICGKNFGTKMSRDDHERTHTGEKPFCCDVCGKCFSSKPHLHVHRVIHSDNRPFKCTYCPKSFRRRPHLVLHIRTHTGEKPYSCEMCSRAFIQKNDMMKHMLTHSNERPFVCECGISFRQKRDLNKHKRKHIDVEISFPTAVTCM